MYYLCAMKSKVFLFALLGVAVAIIFWLSAELQATKRHLQDAEDLIEIQHEMIERLGELDAVRCNVEVHLSNKTTFGNIKQSDINVIADQIQQYTRREILQRDTLCLTPLH